MKRLTSRDGDGDAFVEEGVLKTTTYTERDTAFGKRHVPYGDIYYGNVIERLAQYEDAEGQGRLVVLPCKVGDTVYIIERDECGEMVDFCGYMFLAVTASNSVIVSAFFGDIEDADSTVEELMTETSEGCCASLYVFPREDCYLTREEAEAVLKGGAK